MAGLITMYIPIEISNVQDLNNLIGSSNFVTTYFCSPSTVPANMPPGMNSSDRFFIQINRVGNEIWQKLMPRTGDFCYERTRFPDGSWNAWLRIDNFGYNTLEEFANALKPLLGLS